MIAGSRGRSPLSGSAAMASTASMPDVTSPKIVYWYGSRTSARQMKNCEPLVLGPALAIATVPRL